MTGTSDAKDILLTLHRENSAQVRYYGEQRQSVTNMVAVVTAVVLGLLAYRHSGQLYGNYGLMLHAFFLMALGMFGFVTSLRHHERARLHVQRVHAIRREISRLIGKVAGRGWTLVPLRLYFKNGRAKVEIGLARGKKLHDKREALRERDARREMAKDARQRERD